MATQPTPDRQNGSGLADAGAPVGSYKRASRKGAPRRFSCDYPGCDKLYSRAEHLQRHQLNHEPKEIFLCDVAGCDQKFVRADLLARHRKRHSASYTPRNRMPSFSSSKNEPITPSGSAVLSPIAGVGPRPTFPNAPHDAAILLAPEPRAHQQPPSMSNASPPSIQHPAWHPQMPDMECNIIRPKPGYYPRDDARVNEQAAGVPYHHNAVGHDYQHDEMARENFAVWLFNPHAPYGDFSVAPLPFMDGGLESTLNNNIHYDYESLTSGRSQLETPPRFMENDELLSEFRRREILHRFQEFRPKQPKAEPRIAHLVHETGGDLPALGVEMMRDCLQEYWEHVSPRFPIVHQPTFSSNRCSVFLVMIMIALGAISLRGRDTNGNLPDYSGFADVIITGVRWEIVQADEALPPVELWAAQALLLLEFYEKMYSSRKLHERAHIFHSPALTLLRRGSPLIGRSGSESPPEVQSSDHPHGVSLDSHTWWCRWAETEAMHRVVFAAFMMDIIHAAMFGHDAQMAPHEIRLPLPCDDNLWTASNPNTVRQLDQNLRMYGVKTVSFLDGLKRALHGKEVKTHSFGRMIIMCGLLSVGWHLSHRETHLNWLDFSDPPTTEAHGGWKKILLKAYDDWKHSFDLAQGTVGSPPSVTGPITQSSGSNGPIHSASVLYHLAQLSLHVSIVDCQVYAGARRVLGRKVSVRDYTNVVSRMKHWATLPTTRHAVLHAFQFLHQVLVDPRRSSSGSNDIHDQQQQQQQQQRLSLVGAGAGSSNAGIHLPPIEIQSYSCSSEVDPHRPWVMYYAALCIWSFVRAISRHDSVVHDIPHAENSHHPHPHPPHHHQLHQHPQDSPFRGPPTTATSSNKVLPVNYRRVAAYLSKIAHLNELTETTASSLGGEGLSDLLEALHSIFAEAYSELLHEAHDRLRICKEMLATSPG
ncbi:fungal-specific transcription factor domain-containing protein [Podospora australis]|uniref:Fungal-specific transcription factor domain-containing protein n=1 Tax=Podospora australis TaxID=1536484 RepID=A0AAN6WN73_9PEZI|nr:fungal-specific transcription factor domain-containing protein [Podospora australis]